ncbi:MAG TPA: ABC transporter permease [Acidimicrobiales bacterium]|nr:ABC transporter permease [Acidimicrobiales bacterium]
MTLIVSEQAEAGPALDSRRRRSFLAALWHNSSGRVGCVLVGLVIIGALLGAFSLTPYNPQFQNPLVPLKPPSFSHFAGTDQFGRDEFSLVLQGLYVSLKIACLAVLIAGVIGTIGGIVAGYLGRWPSVVIMRVTDMLFAIPAIVLALAIVTALGPGWLNSALAIGIGYIPIFVRVVRGPVLSLRQAGYVQAGRVLGFSQSRLLFRHVLPNVAGIVAVQVSLALAWSVLAEASLSFLGLGPPPPTASLGEMVSQSSSLAQTAWWTLAAPSIAIIVAVIGFNFLGDGLRDAVDPRSRTR